MKLNDFLGKNPDSKNSDKNIYNIDEEESKEPKESNLKPSTEKRFIKISKNSSISKEKQENNESGENTESKTNDKDVFSINNDSFDEDEEIIAIIKMYQQRSKMDQKDSINKAISLSNEESDDILKARSEELARIELKKNEEIKAREKEIAIENKRKQQEEIKRKKEELEKIKKQKNEEAIQEKKIKEKENFLLKAEELFYKSETEEKYKEKWITTYEKALATPEKKRNYVIKKCIAGRFTIKDDKIEILSNLDTSGKSAADMMKMEWSLD